jgi:hypothetical protein
MCGKDKKRAKRGLSMLRAGGVGKSFVDNFISVFGNLAPLGREKTMVRRKKHSIFSQNMI